MSEESVVGVYDTMDQAEAAVRKLDEAKFPVTQVSIIATNLQSEKQVHGFVLPWTNKGKNKMGLRSAVRTKDDMAVRRAPNRNPGLAGKKALLWAPGIASCYPAGGNETPATQQSPFAS